MTQIRAVLRVWTLAAGLAACSAWPGDARADTEQTSRDDAAAAHALFSQARTSMAKGEIQRACSLFEESFRLRAGTGTLFNLADCWERLGRSARAWAAFLDVAARARNASESEREQVARERAAALEPKLARLTIRVRERTAIPRIERDGVLFRAAMLEIPVPVDPGEHRVTATAPGKLAWEKTLTVAPGAEVALEVPALEDAAPPRAPPQSRARAERALVERERTPRTSSSQRTLGYALGAAGVAALGFGGFFGVRALSQNEDALSKCPNARCRSEAERREHERLVEDARTSRSLAYTGFAVGIAALGGGVLVVLTAEPKASRVAMNPGRALAGLSLAGRW